MQLKFKKSTLIRSFFVHILLPLTSLIILFYFFTLLNGSYVDPTYQSTISVIVVVIFIGLIYLVIKGFNRFFQIFVNHLKDSTPLSISNAPNYQNDLLQESISIPKIKLSKNLFRTMLVLAGIITLIGVFLNPSYQDFKEFSPERKTLGHYAEWKRVKNYLLFSVYEKDVYEREYAEDDFALVYSQKYVGFLKNFTED